MSKKKTGFGGGNLGAQKYSARRNMELFHAAVNKARPTAETSSWRAGPAKFYKRVDGRKLLQERYTKAENAELSKKIFDIHHEPRKAATREFAPGWRVGNISGGMCIDCYRTDNPLVKVYHKLHNYKEKRKAQDKRNKREDAQLAKNISGLTSELAPAVHQREYAYNRYRARFFLDDKKDNATVLHLGLLKKIAAAKSAGPGRRGRPSSAGAASSGQSLQAKGGQQGLGMGYNTYTGAQPSAAPPRPSSAAEYRRGSNLCYSLRPADHPQSLSPQRRGPEPEPRGGTGGFSADDAQRLTGPNGEELGRLDDPVDNDRLLLQSAAHLRPSSGGGRVGTLQRLKAAPRPKSAPSLVARGAGSGVSEQQERRAQAREEAQAVADVVAGLSASAQQEELRLRAQMQALHRMFPAPYSEEDLQLYAGALAVEIEKSRQQTEDAPGTQKMHLAEEYKARPAQAAMQYDQQQLGRRGSHFREVRSLRQFEPPKRQPLLPATMQQREQWSSSPPQKLPKHQAIYSRALATRRLEAGLPVPAEEPTGLPQEQAGNHLVYIGDRQQWVHGDDIFIQATEMTEMNYAAFAVNGRTTHP